MRALDVQLAYRTERDFVQRCLYRLGANRGELSDLSQEVFTVVARRQSEFDGSRPLRPWLFGICTFVVQNARRTRRRKPTVALDEMPEPTGGSSPLEVLSARRRLARARDALETMDVERRAVFVMYEIEGMSGEDIAHALAVPAGTVHSRLFAARKIIAAALAEEEK
jgi:RNA polymerase sigma-70 factor (ECF subfamily)